MISSGTPSYKDLDFYLRATVALRGSKLLLSVGQPPLIKIGGVAKRMNRDEISTVEMDSIASQILDKNGLIELQQAGRLTLTRCIERDEQQHEFDVLFRLDDGKFSISAIPHASA